MALYSVLHKLKLKPAKHCVAIKHELFQVFKGKKGIVKYSGCTADICRLSCFHI